MTPEELDIPPERNARYLDGIRLMGPARRGAVLDAMVRDSRVLLKAGLHFRHPQWSEPQLRWRMCEALYGAEFTARVLGAFP